MKRRADWRFIFFALISVSPFLSGKPPKAAPEPTPVTAVWPSYTLKAETNWQLNLPHGERFDASGLWRSTNGSLLTVNDRHEGVYQIKFLPGTNAADIVLLPECFNTKQLASFSTEKIERYDCEGLCEDSAGRMYVCEEANRWILRLDPKSGKVDRLEIDWTPVEKYFHPTERNASFEGIAIHNNILYVANERQDGRILVVDLTTSQVIDDFTVHPSQTRAKDIHYSDLCWFDGSLFAVLRENHVVVRINPETKAILAEYDYAEIERDPAVAYENDNPTASLMEGLMVDEKNFWLCVDNNGRGRRKFPDDTRPTLFKCPRPDLGK
ncbi:MAG: hypothetical protein JWM68_12 [Verrucomicrobiales bacterium]|nr:hypothetical protein [Verrucomicrobiales bacterium]